MCEFSVDASLCKRCGLCASDCVARIIEQDQRGLPFISEENQAKCYACQHCLAVCPAGAVSVLGKSPSGSKQAGDLNLPSLEQMDDLVRSRRSVRHYHDQNVEKALLGNLLKTLAHAPTGVNAQELTFHLIDDKDDMRRLADRLIATVAAAASDTELCEKHPMLQSIASMPREAASKMLFRTAPHALIVSAPADAPCAEQDVALSLAYFELLAQSAGLGTVWWGLLKRVLMAVPNMKAVLGIPEDHVYYAMLFGVPAIEFARTTQKEEVAVVRRVTL